MGNLMGVGALWVQVTSMREQLRVANLGVCQPRDDAAGEA